MPKVAGYTWPDIIRFSSHTKQCKEEAEEEPLVVVVAVDLVEAEVEVAEAASGREETAQTSQTPIPL